MTKHDKLDALLETLQDLANRRRFNKVDFFKPYTKQRQFFDASLGLRELLLMAGNQLGKTEAGAVATSYHLTGKYPDDWKGRRFDKPTLGWAAGESSLVVRDVQQKKLCGPPGVDADFGTGYISKEDFADKPSMARGVTDAFDTIQVWHHKKVDGVWVRDGISLLRFKSYEQGRLKFQGESIDFGWLDEEPDISVYSEILTRITATRGIIYMTFTPLKGMSFVVARFLNEKSEDRGIVTMIIEDAEHISPEERKKIVAGYPEHEREARAKGIPMLGSGRIFPVAEETIAEDALTYIPESWTKLWSIDFGIAHPFAAVLMLWDRDMDVLHVHATIRMKDGLPLNHAAAMKPIGADVPVAWPQDGTAREHGTGETLASLYKKQDLRMLPDHATWPDGGVSTEAGVMEMYGRMTTGRFKVARQLLQGEWGEEFRLYHRKDGLIVKERDDLMSATRVGVMAKRHGIHVVLGGKRTKRRGREDDIADGVEFDLFA